MANETLPNYLITSSNIPKHIPLKQQNYYMAIRIKRYLNEKENT